MSPDLQNPGGEHSLIPPEYIAELVSELAERYQLASLRPLLEVFRASTERSDLSVAVLGRFKAGKSSFLNDVIGRDVLPVGVIPVTSLITDVTYGPEDVGHVRFATGREIEIPVENVHSYVSEAENPLNRKQVASVSIRLRSLSAWPNLHFIDTPGLESAFAHNTEASLGWTPHVDIALVAIGVDPPLSAHDLALIESLFRYTPRVAILLTKIDLLEQNQLSEVIEYVRSQLAARFEQNIPIYPYSTRPGYQEFKRAFEDNLLNQVAADIASERRSISQRKMATLLGDCEQYIRLTLRSAEMLDTERFTLQKQLLAEQESLADTRLEIGLIARHAAAGTRSIIERALAPAEKPTRTKLLEAFEEHSKELPKSLDTLRHAFSDWLQAALSNELQSLSASKRSEFIRPLADVQRQYQGVLQNFRDRLSERTYTLYGVPLKTTESEIEPHPPKMPDVKIGKAFDHNWELLSPVTPMSLLRGAVFHRFRNRIADEVFKNLSRLTSQWEEIVHSAIFELQREAEKRIEDLLATVHGLVSASTDSAPQIRADLERLRVASAAIQDDDPIKLESS
jgi:GTP-binding protein EngB required for normal cell division